MSSPLFYFFAQYLLLNLSKQLNISLMFSYKTLLLIQYILFESRFFFKIYFYYFFIGKADIQRGETEKKIFRPMIHSPSERNGPILCRSEARSLFRVSHAGAGSQSFGLSSTAFPGHRQGAGREAGLPGLEPAPIWDPGRAR